MSVLPQPVAISDAWVLRVWPTGETSVIASLLTGKHGYVRIIAKSARRPTSQLRPLVQSGRMVCLEFSLVEGRDLQYLRGGSLLLDPLAQAANLEKSAYLLAAVELVDRYHPAEVQEGGLFELCRDYVRMLSCAPSGAEAYLFFAFELGLLNLHGIAPAWDTCTGCGKPLTIPREGGLWFDPAGGGAVCLRCGGAEQPFQRKRLSAEVHATLRRAAADGLSEQEPRSLERSVRKEMGAVLHRFLEYHVPGYRLPAALEILRPHPCGQAATTGPFDSGKDSKQ